MYSCTFHNSGCNSNFSIRRHVSSLVQLNFSILTLLAAKLSKQSRNV
nr:unnamed protein product [Callosobruchus chinensis]